MYKFILNVKLIKQAILNNVEPERQSYHFAKGALKEIIPILVWLLTKKEEDEDEDDWNVSMAAATCLGLFSVVVQDSIVEHVLGFIEVNIKSTDWKHREAAVMAFGSILEGPGHKVLGPLCVAVSY